MRLKDHPCLRPFCRSSTRTSSFELHRDSCVSHSHPETSLCQDTNGGAIRDLVWVGLSFQKTFQPWTISWFRGWSINPPQNDFSNSWDEAPIPNSLDFFRTSRTTTRSTICPNLPNPHSLFQVLQVSGSTSASCQRKDCLTGSWCNLQGTKRLPSR